MKSLVLYGMVIAWFVAVALAVTAFGLLPKPALQPAQPIEFPHRIHAGDLGMQCTDCHQYAEKSIYAGLPKAEFCMSCHEGVATDKPEIVKLTELYEAGKPVEWVRVYQTKPHVYFSHRRHVLSNVKCQECHGPVELMTTAQRVTNLDMGWCVQCHRRTGAPRECITCHK